MDLIIRGGKTVLQNTIRIVDIAISKGKIAAIGNHLNMNARSEIDAAWDAGSAGQ